MKAVLCREWGTPDVLRLEEIAGKNLKPDDVRIHVRAAGVNFADSLMSGGTYQVRPPFPFTRGLEAAGEIFETGSSVKRLRVGQRILAVLRNGGGYAGEGTSWASRSATQNTKWTPPLTDGPLIRACRRRTALRSPPDRAKGQASPARPRRGSAPVAGPVTPVRCG